MRRSRGSSQDESVSIALGVQQRNFNKMYTDVNEKVLDQFQVQVRIDKDGLDVAIERQAVIYQEISEKVAAVTSIRDAIKDVVDATEGNLSVSHREVLLRRVKDEKGRVTDKQVSEAVRKDQVFIKASMRFNVAKSMASRWLSLKGSFDQRASMLKLLANLFVSNYYTVSSVSGDTDSQREVVRRAKRGALSSDRRRRTSK